jgi:N-acetylglutamate synthase-like GNAT family acetyltransferase
MSLNIRKAEKGDIDSISILMTDLSRHFITPDNVLNRLQLVAESPIDSLYVCEDNGKILGLLGFRVRENIEEVSRFGEVSAIVVNAKEKRRGVGRFMMDYAEKLGRELGCKETWLVSGFAREKEAHLFYKQLGYQPTGYRFVKLFDNGGRGLNPPPSNTSPFQSPQE